MCDNDILVTQKEGAQLVNIMGIIIRMEFIRIKNAEIFSIKLFSKTKLSFNFLNLNL